MSKIERASAIFFAVGVIGIIDMYAPLEFTWGTCITLIVISLALDMCT